MKRSSAVMLRMPVRVNDETGVGVKTVRERLVYARISTPGGVEFFRAAQLDIKPQLRFEVALEEYRDEPELSWHGKVYAIYRTYIRGQDTIELYGEVRKGV